MKKLKLAREQDADALEDWCWLKLADVKWLVILRVSDNAKNFIASKE